MKKARAMILVCLLLAACLLPETGLAEAAAEATPAIDLTGLINAVIAVLGALVTYRLIPWLKARTTAEQARRSARRSTARNSSITRGKSATGWTMPRTGSRNMDIR